MLTKFMMGKPTMLWDQYLDQALSSTRVRTHSTTGYSPFYLKYGRHPILPLDKNPPRLIEIEASSEETENRIKDLRHACLEANMRMYERAMASLKGREERVKLHNFNKNDYVLVRNEYTQKFQARWFGLYKIIDQMPLGTYQLADPHRRPLCNLINGQRLVKAHVVGDPKDLWTSSALRN
jgi:hypothetical protein